MANSINGFRFTDGYEDVFSYTTDHDGTYTYVCAPDPFPTLPGESYHDYYARWKNALMASGVDFDA